ncbi:unnamed protein product [Victoria cruziana]
MERNNSFGMTWADQWDTKDDRPASATGAGGPAKGKAKYAKMVGDGMKKVKEGTASGVKWMKHLYTKTTQKH